ncbi:MAG: hypothetical protein ACJAWV_001193 [Flammeovirgaceae bacterium]
MKGDKIIVSVKSKYNPSIKTTKDVPLTYTYAKGGTGFDWSASKYGYSGDNLKFEITTDKHAVTGAPLYKYRTTNLTRNIIVAEGKLAHNQILQLWVKGQPGKPHHHGADDNTRGGDGGNGGTITIYKDPSVKSIDFIDTKIFGGRGGKGAYSGTDGRLGRDGKVNVVTKTISF